MGKQAGEDEKEAVITYEKHGIKIEIRLDPQRSRVFLAAIREAVDIVLPLHDESLFTLHTMVDSIGIGLGDDSVVWGAVLARA